MYESPIEKVFGEIQSQIIKQDDENVMYAVKQAIGYSVDKNELIKALKYDREQYEKGYRDGLNADKWIPVSERLPEKDEYVDDVCKYYLIQDEYGDMHVAHYSSIGWIPTHSLKAIGDDVVAWMNLPENYKAESEE